MKFNNRFFAKIEILFITSLLAFCSIVYELLLSNTLAIVTGNYVWWQSLTVGIFIGGLGLGAFYSDKLQDTYKSLINVELALSFLGAISVVFVYIFHGAYKYTDNLFFFTQDFGSALYLQNSFILKVLFFVSIQLLTLSIGILSGFEIPLMMKVAEDKLGKAEEGEHQILGVNYLGTLIGTIFFAYILLPQLDVIKTAVAVSILNLFVCVYILLKYSRAHIKTHTPLVLVVFFISVSIGLNEQVITQRYLKFFYYLPKILAQNTTDTDDLIRRVDNMKPIERSKSLYQYLDIFSYPTVEDGISKDSTILTLDTNFQFNTTTEYFYHQGFAHASIAMNKSIPKRVLVLGGGDGLLIRELIRYEEIEFIKHIELDQKMVDLAKGRFVNLNKHALDDKRVHTEINDGFYFVRNTNEKYDAIFIDFPYPNSYDLARLYSLEFYTYVKRTLAPNGFVVLDCPFYPQEDYTKNRYQDKPALAPVFNDVHILSNSVMASTFYYSGFQTIFPYRVADESFIFLKANPGSIDFDFLEHTDIKMIEPKALAEMKQIKNQIFPYRISENLVNSIFKPTIVKKNEF